MKREVVTCDTQSCRKLGDAKCALCDGDFCFEHLPIKLALSYGTVSPKRPDNVSQAQFVEYDETIESPLCLPCNTFLTGADGVMAAIMATHNTVRPFHARLLATFGKLVDDLKAIKAAHRLGARGEDLLKAATPEKP